MSQVLVDERIPSLRRGYRFQWEPAQQGHVLLYPEGMIKLNDSAAQILKEVDGQRSVAQITDELVRRFPEVDGVAEDILEFLEVAHARFWIEMR